MTFKQTESGGARQRHIPNPPTETRIEPLGWVSSLTIKPIIEMLQKPVLNKVAFPSGSFRPVMET